MSKLVLATNNIHKISEISSILTGSGIEILSARDFPDFPEIEETGETLAENAIIKAKAIWRRYGYPSVADDTGLEVDCLHGAPGVYSARFAGPGCTYEDNNRRLLYLLKDIPNSQRKARFKTVIAFVDPKGEVFHVEGILEGSIASAPTGTYGFGYDPIFLVEDSGRTLAEYPPQEKNSISHRSRALARIRPIILKVLIGSDHLNAT